MKGDFSRVLFDIRNHYTGVLQQEGRVWLDADWNEAVEEQLALMEVGLKDLIGNSGMASASAFQISPATNPAAPYDFQISAGRAYLNGAQCQLDANTTYVNQPDYLDPTPVVLGSGSTTTALVYLEVWRRLITYLEDDSIRDPGLGGPDTSARLKTIAQIKVSVLPPAAANITADQAIQFLPGSGQGTLSTQSTSPAHENHLYRVQVHDPGDITPATNSGASMTALASDVLAGSVTLLLATPLSASQISGALRTGSVIVSDLTGTSERGIVSQVSPDGTTITLVQPLANSYTVANAALVAAGLARLKWSRNNAAFSVSVVSVQPDLVTLTLASLGRDAATVLRQGDLVEVIDDASELGPGKGHLTTLASDPDPDLFTVVLTDPLPQAFKLSSPTTPPSPLTSARHLIVRRWDGATDAVGSTALDPNPVRGLDGGLQILVGGSDLRAGDYWQFNTRAADGSVQMLVNAPPTGVIRLRTPLAVVSWGPPPSSPPSSPPGGVAMTVLRDARKLFQPLVNAPPPDKGIHVSGLAVVDASSGTASPLFNDSNIPASSFGGINITCDSPVSLPSPATCVVDVESPFSFPSAAGPEIPGASVPGYLRTPLSARVTAQGNIISWQAGPQTQSYVNTLLAKVPGDRGILARLKLNGNFIWSQNDSSAYVDGEAFASHAREISRLPMGPTPITIFGTGVADIGSLAADGVIDFHYKLISSADPTVGENVFVAHSNMYPIPPWVANGPNSKWIAPLPNAAANLSPGVYRYRTTFDLTGMDPNTAVLNGQWATDNLGLIQLNGVTVPNSASQQEFLGFTIFSITSGFVPGINVLDFVVTNLPLGPPNPPNSPNPTGLRVDIGGFATQTPKSNVFLMLPSGDKRRGGDFQMWFWLVPGAVFITGIQVTPRGPIQAQTSATVVLTLDAVVPLGGPPAIVAVTITNAGILQANAATPISIFGTGVASPGQLAMDGTTDAHYTLVNSADPQTPGGAVFVANSNTYPIPPWLNNGPVSKWISPLPNASANLNHGNYTYRTTFDLTGMDPSTAVLTGQFAADDLVVIQLNGVQVPNNGVTVPNIPTTGGFTSFTTFKISNALFSPPQVIFNNGLNTLDFIVNNAPLFPTPTGLRVDITGTANLLPPNNITVTNQATTPPSQSVAVPVPGGSRTASFVVTGLAPGQSDIQASLGGPTVSTTLAVIASGQDFTLQVTPPLQTIVAGGSANYAVTVAPVNSFAGAVNLSVSGLPPQATAVFSPASISGGGSAILAVNTAGATAAGSNTLTILARSSDGTITHSIAVTLVVVQLQLAVKLRPTAFLQDSDRSDVFIDFGGPFRYPVALGGDLGGVYIAPDIDTDLGPVRFLGRVPFNDPTKAFDGDPSTFAWADSISGCNWFGWSPLQRTPTAISLRVLSQVLPPGGTTFAASVAVMYSTDGGNTFAPIYRTVSGRPLTTDQISLPANTDITQVQVRASYIGGFEAARVQIHEIWIEVTG